MGILSVMTGGDGPNMEGKVIALILNIISLIIPVVIISYINEIDKTPCGRIEEGKKNFIYYLNWFQAIMAGVGVTVVLLAIILKR